jgi:hypothetical protein
MASLQPLRIGIRLTNLGYTIFGGGTPLPGGPPNGDTFVQGINTYLWTVFFKIDGDTTSVGANLQLRLQPFGLRAAFASAPPG